MAICKENYLLVALLLLNLLLNTNGVQVQENSPVVVSLEPYEQRTLSFSIVHSTSHKRFASLQAHTQYEPLSISLTEHYNMLYSYNGSNAGILVEISQKTKEVPFYVTSGADAVIQVQVVAVIFEPTSPIPGGCCLSCELENDPNLFLTYNDYSTTITFGKSNVYEHSACDSSMYPPEFRLNYSLYKLYIGEESLHVSDLMAAMKKMYTVDSIKMHAEKVGSLTTGMPKITVDSEQGQGVVYSLIVEDPQGSSSVYVPTVTYACNFTAKVDNCDAIVHYYSPSNVIVAMLMILVGLFLTFAGHRYFNITIFIGGVVIYSCIFYIVFVTETDLTNTARLWMSLFMGCLFGLFLSLMWSVFGLTMLHVFHTGLMFGVLVASSLFFIPDFEEIHLWKSDVSFTVFFVALVIIIASAGLIFMKQFHILCTSTVGSYGFVAGIDYFIHSSLRFIVFNMIRRAIGHGVYLPPFQTYDYLLLGVWIFLVICGFVFQWHLAKGKPNFPKGQNYFKKRIQRQRRNRQLEEECRRENMPILINYNKYGSNNVC